MKKRFALPALAVLVAAASGCATTTNSTLSPYGEYDETYVAQVERSARRAGVEVYWYQLPQKRVAAATN